MEAWVKAVPSSEMSCVHDPSKILFIKTHSYAFLALSSLHVDFLQGKPLMCAGTGKLRQ